jgi:hypothetical protein
MFSSLIDPNASVISGSPTADACEKTKTKQAHRHKKCKIG